MNVRAVIRILGNYLLMLAAFVSIGLLVSLYFQFFANLPSAHAPHPTTGFILTIALCLFIAAIFKSIPKKLDQSVQLREAIFLVVMVWFVTSIVGALPFWFSNSLHHFIDAWFESVSGITTTGSSILHPKLFNAQGQEIQITSIYSGVQEIKYHFYGTVQPVIDPVSKAVVYTGIEAFPYALIFWRSFLHWYGGMGIILLFVAILPALGMQGKMLFRYESTGPLFQPLLPRAKDTAVILLKIYVFITFIGIIFLMATNKALTLFDAINISFSSVSTGGFAHKNASIGSFNSVNTEIVTILLMLAGGINFALYYDILKGRFFKLWDTELLSFLGIVLLFSSLAAYGIYGAQKFLLTGATQETYGFYDSIRYAFFQVISCITNTGFVTCDYDQWPFFSQGIMYIAMYFGAMAGSTCGGLKIIRICILWQLLRHASSRLFRRNEIRIIRVGQRDIDTETVVGVLSFFLVVIVVSMIGVFLLVFSGVDFETAFGLSGCMVNNTGASFRVVGPVESCAVLSYFSKFICIVWMLLGRLEYYSWFVLFMPSFWKKR